jgi:hypothetical protein
MKIIGILLIAFGLADFIGSWSNYDVWHQWFHIEKPEVLGRFSGYIEMALGYFLIRLGAKPTKKTEEPASQDAANTPAAPHDK